LPVQPLHFFGVLIVNRSKDSAMPDAGEAAAFKKAESFLYDRINYEKIRSPTKAYPFRLNRMRQLIAALGYAEALAPVDGLPIVHPNESTPGRSGNTAPLVFHVGGTKGKGSVSTMIAAILKSAGYRVGLYTSPHVESLCERFQIDGKPCSDWQFVEMMQRFRPIPESQEASFFELTTAGAYDLFRLQKCDAIVLEVGLGGRLDSTNVFQSDMTVITNIGLDHQAVLGDTHAEIAGEKAGILKPGVPLVTGVRHPDAWRVIGNQAERLGCTVSRLDDEFTVQWQPDSLWGSHVRVRPNRLTPALPRGEQDFSFDLELDGRHQADNASLAVMAVALSNARIRHEQHPHYDQPICNVMTPSHLSSALSKVHPIGRMERFRLPLGVNVLLDSAHNEDSVAALVAVIGNRLSPPVTVLFGTSQDKSSDKMLNQLATVADRIVLTRFTGNPRWRDPESLRTEIPASANVDVSVQADPQLALSQVISAAQSDGRWIVVCGSFFLAAELRPILRTALITD
jgi:dihydrofolate synthase / folylpolyglutamate synthase